jgi:HTH-type transcriptional regulator/antitoxin HigA
MEKMGVTTSRPEYATLLVKTLPAVIHTARRLEELMEANGLKQEDLVGIFGTPSIISEVLNGKRKLTTDHIRKLSHRFHVSPELFF